MRYQEVNHLATRLPPPELCSSPRGPFLPRLKLREISRSTRLFLSLELPHDLLASASLQHFPTERSFRSPKVVRASHELRPSLLASPRSCEDKKTLRPKVVHMGLRPVAANFLLDRREIV